MILESSSEDETYQQQSVRSLTFTSIGIDLTSARLSAPGCREFMMKKDDRNDVLWV